MSAGSLRRPQIGGPREQVGRPRHHPYEPEWASYRFHMTHRLSLLERRARSHSLLLPLGLLLGIAPVSCFEDPEGSLDSAAGQADGAAEATSGGETGQGGTSTSGAGSATSAGEDGTASGSTGSDTDSGETSETSAGGVDTQGDGSEPCDPLASLCVEEPLPGWNGPAAVFEGASDQSSPGCSGLYPDDGVEAFAGFVGPDASCECSCGPPANESCGEVEVRRQGTASNACLQLGEAPQVVDGACGALDTSYAGGAFWRVSEFEYSAGACTPERIDSTAPAGFDTRVLACQGASPPGACADEGDVCVPRPVAPFGASVCIWMEGDVTCPTASDYSVRTLRYQSFDDDRSCTACSCGDSMGSCSGGRVTFGQSCGGLAAGTLDAGECGRVGATSAQTVAVATASASTPSGSCTPSGGAATGEASPSEPVTLCCLP